LPGITANGICNAPSKVLACSYSSGSAESAVSPEITTRSGSGDMVFSVSIERSSAAAVSTRFVSQYAWTRDVQVENLGDQNGPRSQDHLHWVAAVYGTAS